MRGMFHGIQYHEKGLHNYFTPWHRMYSGLQGQHNQDSNTSWKKRVGISMMEWLGVIPLNCSNWWEISVKYWRRNYTVTLLHSDWLYLLLHGVKIHTCSLYKMFLVFNSCDCNFTDVTCWLKITIIIITWCGIIWFFSFSTDFEIIQFCRSPL